MALRRRDEILKVIRGAAVHSQEDLQHRLARRGIEVAQPTLSRELKKRMDREKAARDSGRPAPEPGSLP